MPKANHPPLARGCFEAFRFGHSFVILVSSFVIGQGLRSAMQGFDPHKPLAPPVRSAILRALFQTTSSPFITMSQHSSLKTAGSVATKRSVLKRGERIKLLKARGLWTEGRLPTNLPKTKSE